MTQSCEFTGPLVAGNLLIVNISAFCRQRAKGATGGRHEFEGQKGVSAISFLILGFPHAGLCSRLFGVLCPGSPGKFPNADSRALYPGDSDPPGVGWVLNSGSVFWEPLVWSHPYLFDGERHPMSYEALDGLQRTPQHTTPSDPQLPHREGECQPQPARSAVAGPASFGARVLALGRQSSGFLLVLRAFPGPLSTGTFSEGTCPPAAVHLQTGQCLDTLLQALKRHLKVAGSQFE